MKQQLLLILVMISVTISGFADPTEDLTEAEADALIARFEENPYIFSFCDCCDMTYGHLIKIETMKKIPCSYNENYISIEVKGTLIADVGLTSNEAGDINFMKSGTEFTEIIALNYTWGFENGLAVPLGYLEHSILYESCDEFAQVPFSDGSEEYLEFYNKWILPYEVKSVTTTGKKLNMRDGFSLTANVVKQLKKGTVCTVIKRTNRPHKVATYYDFWYYVELKDGTTGWILGEFTDANISVGNKLRINGEKVNIRQEPTLEGKIITQVNGNNNTVYEVVKTSSELYHIDGIADYWYRIKIGKKEGWVYGQLTTVARFLPD